MAHSSRSRREVDRQEKHPEVLVARGDLSPDDKRFITEFLKRVAGFSAIQYTPADEYDARPQQPVHISLLKPGVTEGLFRFDEIVNPDDFVVREHVEDFKRRYVYPNELCNTFVGRTFNYIVDGRGSRFVSSWSTNPEQPGRFFRDPAPIAKADVRLRDEIDLPPYPNTIDGTSKSAYCARFAIRAGSIIEATDALWEHVDIDNLKVAEYGLHLVATQLQAQLT